MGYCIVRFISLSSSNTPPCFSSYIAHAGCRSALDSVGKIIEVTKYTEKLVPSTRFVAVDGVAPKVSEMSFVAPSASVIGDVTIGKESRFVRWNYQLIW